VVSVSLVAAIYLGNRLLGVEKLKIFDLSFSDGRTCRVIDPDPIEDAAESLRSYQAVFKPGYLVGMQRIVAPPPEKLPWKRQAEALWTIGAFALSRLPTGEFHCFWPGGELVGDKDAISATVRRLWVEHS
jgi:hypothetical protein